MILLRKLLIKLIPVLINLYHETSATKDQQIGIVFPNKKHNYRISVNYDYRYNQYGQKRIGGN